MHAPRQDADAHDGVMARRLSNHLNSKGTDLMPALNERPYLSPTQLDMFTRCGEAYRRRYLEHEKIPPGVAMLKGTGFHRGAETNFTQKIDSHQDLPVTQIIEAAVAGFESEMHGGYSLQEDEEARGKDVVLGEAKDELVALATLHAVEQAPDYQPTMVERKVLISLPGPRDLMGVIDLADDQDRVVDFKTSGRKKSQGDADSSVQLSVYAAAYQVETGKPPAELRLDTAVKTKTKAYRDVVTTERDADDLTALANRINAISRAIDAGSFPPAAPGAWNCSDKWCGYYRTCPFVNPKRRAGAQGD